MVVDSFEAALRERAAAFAGEAADAQDSSSPAAMEVCALSHGAAAQGTTAHVCGGFI